jgi:predicted O-methyltransferase YrrM
MRARRLLFGLATVLGIAERGFFIPYRYAATLPRGPKRIGYPGIEALLARSEDDFRAMLTAIDAHDEALRAIGEAPPPAPRWTQDWFPRLDAAAAYALVRALKPRRIVEIGSGHSTRFLARAVADGRLDTRITAIDPAPRAPLAGLDVTFLRATVQDAGDAPFAGLGPGDVLFIDSSHILMPGSDVDWLINRVLPALPAGIYLHMHDVFLPDDYPADWAWRGYNEQLVVAALIHGGGYRPRFASHYVVTRMAGDLEASAVDRLPLPPGAHESSLWLEKL